MVEFDAKLLTPIVKNLTAIENYNTSMQLPHTFSLSSILSGLDTERFYTYKGSLTTPPCAEAVTWVVFSDYLPISVFQVLYSYYLQNTRHGLHLSICIEPNASRIKPIITYCASTIIILIIYLFINTTEILSNVSR